MGYNQFCLAPGIAGQAQVHCNSICENTCDFPLDTAQHRIRGERYARHWHDLAAIARSSHFERILSNSSIASMVADHKQWFFREKDAQGYLVDYAAAARGQLRLVPEGRAREALAADYNAMRDAGVLLAGAMTFDELMQACGELQTRINQAVSAKLFID